jgi:NADPH:quinone reductase-like Zn-dependent oxidoreductase
MLLLCNCTDFLPGVLTVQLAKLFGFHVTAVCSTRHSTYLRDELGVDAVIDYTAPDFKSVPAAMSTHQPVNLIVDCVGGETARSILLEPTCVVSGGKIILLAQPLDSYGEETKQKAKRRGQEVNVDQEFFIVKMDPSQLTELGHLIAEGKLTPQLDAVFPLEQGREAVMKIEKKGAVQRGKVVIRVSNNDEQGMTV